MIEFLMNTSVNLEPFLLLLVLFIFHKPLSGERKQRYTFCAENISYISYFFIYKDNISVNVPVLASWLIFNCSPLARCCEANKVRNSN